MGNLLIIGNSLLGVNKENQYNLLTNLIQKSTFLKPCFVKLTLINWNGGNINSLNILNYK
jgi:hypothetical protein